MPKRRHVDLESPDWYRKMKAEQARREALSTTALLEELDKAELAWVKAVEQRQGTVPFVKPMWMKTVPKPWWWMRLWVLLPRVRDLNVTWRGHSFAEWLLFYELERERVERGGDFRRMNAIRVRYGWRTFPQPGRSIVAVSLPPQPSLRAAGREVLDVLRGWWTELQRI